MKPPSGTPGEILAPYDIALSDEGTLVVSESNPATLNLYDEGGHHLRTIGREGDGSGEFRAGFIAVPPAGVPRVTELIK